MRKKFCTVVHSYQYRLNTLTFVTCRMKLLEEMVESANSDKKSAENQLTEALEVAKASEIEITRLKTALDSAKEKVITVLHFKDFVIMTFPDSKTITTVNEGQRVMQVSGSLYIFQFHL